MKNSRFLMLFYLSLITSCAIKSANSVTNNRDISSKAVIGDSKNPWFFKRLPDYTPVSSSYVGPRPLIADKDGMPKSATQPKVTADGRWMFFLSTEKLTSDAVEGIHNIYRMRLAEDSGMKDGSIELVSRGSTQIFTLSCGTITAPAEISDRDSYGYDVSSDGRYISFISESNKLTPLATCDETTKTPKLTVQPEYVSPKQAYWRDIDANITKIISGENSVYGKIGSRIGISDKTTISGNGKYVAFVASSIELMSLAPTEELPEYDGRFTGVFMHDVERNETAWVSFPSKAENPISKKLDKIDGDSFQPDLNEDGSQLVFTSEAKLLPEDQTLTLADGTTIADIYKAKFNKTAKGVDIGRRTDFSLVSVQRGSTISEGVFGSSNPSISSDGKCVLFQSFKEPLSVTDLGPDFPPATGDQFGMMVYLRNTDLNQTSIISVGATEDHGSYNFRPIVGQKNVMNPSLSPDCKYATFSVEDNNVYQTKKSADYMKKSLKSKLSDGTEVEISCFNSVTSNFQDRSLMFLPNVGSPSLLDSKMINIGWAEARDKACMTALHPNTFNKLQTYLIEINPGDSKPQKIVPLSISRERRVLNWYRPIYKDPTNPGTYITEFSVVNQLLYADKDCGQTSISNDAKSIVFECTADTLVPNLSEEKLNELYKPVRSTAGGVESDYYSTPIFPDVMWYMHDPIAIPAVSTPRGELEPPRIMPRSRFHPMEMYYFGRKTDNWGVYGYTGRSISFSLDK